MRIPKWVFCATLTLGFQANACDWLNPVTTMLFKRTPEATEAAYKNFFKRFDAPLLKSETDVEVAYNQLMELPDPIAGSWAAKKLKAYQDALYRLSDKEKDVALSSSASSLTDPVNLKLFLSGEDDYAIGAFSIGEVQHHRPLWNRKHEAVWRARAVRLMTDFGNRKPNVYLNGGHAEHLEEGLFSPNRELGPDAFAETLKNWGTDPKSPLFSYAVKLSISYAKQSGGTFPRPITQLFQGYLEPNIVPPQKRNPIYEKQIRQILEAVTHKPDTD